MLRSEYIFLIKTNMIDHLNLVSSTVVDALRHVLVIVERTFDPQLQLFDNI